MKNDLWLKANWPAPEWLKAGTSYRPGGHSQGPYESLNLAQHVQDTLDLVEQNRLLLKQNLQLPRDPLWLDQIHSNRILNADKNPQSLEADGAYTSETGMVVAVLTADCLPLLLCDLKRRKIAAIHVGWRGFSQGIVVNAIQCFSNNKEALMAWTGPCISAKHYEIEEQVRQACLARGKYLEGGFQATKKGHWLADLRQLVSLELRQQGLKNIYTSQSCTFAEREKWFSYRRNGQTGRMASLIWMDENTPQKFVDGCSNPK